MENVQGKTGTDAHSLQTDGIFPFSSNTVNTHPMANFSPGEWQGILVLVIGEAIHLLKSTM